MALDTRNMCYSLRTWQEQCLHDESLYFPPASPNDQLNLHIYTFLRWEYVERVIVIEPNEM